jgi:hypothetical protein
MTSYRIAACLLLCLLSFVVQTFANSNTGFWYSDNRGPETKYDTVPYANMTVKVNRPFTEGPGQDLVKDPFNTSISLYVGPTINRQTFDTQFVLDMNYAIGIDVDRVYVLYVEPGRVHFSWESNFVIVSFIFLERNGTTGMTLLEAIATLTNQIQTPESRLYNGTHVTSEIDSQWGLEVKTWDVSMKLTYAIDVIGQNAVKDSYYLNQGSLGICDVDGADEVPVYCEFERFFEDDIARALDISYYRVQVLFIKAAALDSVLVTFRISPPRRDATSEANVTMAIADLMVQTADLSSVLYKGNVTIRTGESTHWHHHLFPLHVHSEVPLLMPRHSFFHYLTSTRLIYSVLIPSLYPFRRSLLGHQQVRADSPATGRQVHPEVLRVRPEPPGQDHALVADLRL